MSELLIVKDVRKEYFEADRPLVVLDDLDLTVRAGEVLAITGPSGVGKSTLLHILGLLDTPTSGSVVYDGEDVGAAPTWLRASFRNAEFGFVFQFYHLLPDLDALRNIMLPAMVRTSWFGWPAHSGDVRERAAGLLGEIGLADRASHKPSKLSGGEKQRVAIARALINDPKIVFCDEPTGNLDEHTADRVLEQFLALVRGEGSAALVATHNERLAAKMDRVLRLHEGLLE